MSPSAPDPHPWPLFGLRITTPRLELRLPTDAELIELLDVIEAGVHPPDEMPFCVPWTREPRPERDRSTLQRHWRQRATWEADDWHLMLVAFVDGRPVGAQDVSARHFAILRTVDSGSWIGQRFQRRGLGTEMRAAMLHFAFDALGAAWAKSSYWDGNDASRRVSESLGYRPNGFSNEVSDDRPRCMRHVMLGREAWLERRRQDIAVHGLDPCLSMFGAEPAATAVGAPTIA